jgi:hypothetical protein
VRVFWYISKTKVDQMLSQRETLFDKLEKTISASFKAEIKIPIVSVGAEAKFSEVDPNQIKNLEKLERQLRNSGLVRTIEELEHGNQPLFFEFQAQSARLIQGGQFWVAGLEGKTGVLLVGSAAHCVGASSEKDLISPSANPLGSINALFEKKHLEVGMGHDLFYAWSCIIDESVHQLGDFNALPRAKGIAVFAGSWKDNASENQQFERIFVGSPIFVEQIER